jgi:hypothetical protein
MRPKVNDQPWVDRFLLHLLADPLLFQAPSSPQPSGSPSPVLFFNHHYRFCDVFLKKQPARRFRLIRRIASAGSHPPDRIRRITSAHLIQFQIYFRLFEKIISCPLRLGNGVKLTGA